MEHQNEMKFIQWSFLTTCALHAHIPKLLQFTASLRVFAAILPDPMGADVYILINLSARKEGGFIHEGQDSG
ncbi:hypothetical protein [Pantoea agglomerans]|jgi:hypothetical protein|uniref:hypothetical protein n=2 Tax=Enterobacter agglomerans TaxID=549 RepID=UPI00320B91BE